MRRRKIIGIDTVLKERTKLLAVSIEGRLLHRDGDTPEVQATRLASLLAEASWFRTVPGVGALQLFEARLPHEDRALQFQPESIVLVKRPREVTA